MAMAIVGAVQAAEDNWRIGIKADDGAGLGGAPATQLGVSATGVGSMVAAYGVDITGTTIWVVGDRGDSNTYGRDIKVGDTSLPKVWDLRVAALPSSAYTAIRLQFLQVNPTYNQPASVGGVPVVYNLKMVNNRGVAGAPANGTIWNLTTLPTQIITPTLPMLNLSGASHAAMLAEGYVMKFTQEPVPEPSSLLALGTGFAALAGLVIRRRRA